MPTSKTLNAVIGDVIQSEHQKVGMTAEDLAGAVTMPLSTMRKKIAGRSPFLVSEIIAIARVVAEKSGVEWPEVAKRMLDDAQRIWERVSAAAATKDDLQERREKQEQARSMSTEELEGQGQRAATTDEELGSDESGAP